MKKEIYLSYVETEHDNSIVMIYDWKLYWIELERISRLKHFEIKEWSNSYLVKKYFHKWLDYLLSIVWDYSDFNVIWLFICSDLSIINDYNFKFSIVKDFYLIDNSNYNSSNNFLSDNWLVESHHFFHSLSSYFSSDFQESAILTFDWSWDDWECSISEKVFMQSIYHWNKNNVSLVEWSLFSREKCLYWIWTIYEFVSQLIWLEPWSIMWLSAYWDKNRFENIKLFSYEWWNVYFSHKWIEYENLKSFFTNLYWINENDYLEKDITKTIFADISAHLQFETEKAIKYLWKRAKELTNSKNLCISGWVWLNVLANTILAKECWFENIFVQSAVWDQWISLGWLYYLYYIFKNNSLKIPFRPDLWKVYSKWIIEWNLDNYKNKLIIQNLDFEFVSDELSKNKIFAIFNLWSEFWPRALWFRSILASPIDKENNIKVNKIKNREKWRPLAPIILEEYFKDFLEENFISPYMTLSSSVKKFKVNTIPWVIHIDNTVRYQTVNKDNNLIIYNILIYFFKKTWIPILINTSLNVKSEPIVETPKEAIEMFLSTDLDYLIIWGYLVSKSKKYPEYLFNYDKNLFQISFSETDKFNYIKIRDYCEKIFFPQDIKIEFCFLYKDKLSYKFLLLNNLYKINFFLVKDENVWLYFRHKDLWYNLSWKIYFNNDLSDILNKINYLIINNYDLFFKLFSKLN
jgi:carbamoyltransferase